MRGQTVIPIEIIVDASLETFSSERNNELIGELKLLLSTRREKRIIYIWSASGAGKSHLLTLCGALWKNGEAVYLSCLQDFDSNLLDQIKDDTLVCVDHVLYSHCMI